MCERCPALITELREMDPRLDEAGAVNVLWSFTAFPFNSFEETREQALEHMSVRLAHQNEER